MKKALFIVIFSLFLSQYLYGFDNISVPLDPPQNGTMLGNCEVYLGKYTAKTTQIILSDFSAQVFPKRTNNALDNGGSRPFANITLSGIESSCGITNISNLIIDGANNTFDSDDYFGFKVQGLDPNTNQMTLYEFAFSGATNTTIIATISPVFDTVLPVVTLSGNSSIIIPFESTYTEAGATRTDNVDGSGSMFTGTYGQTGSFQVSGTVNTVIAGNYVLEYQKVDEAGNISNIAARTVIVGAPGATLTPIIDGISRLSGYTTPARIYHVRTGLDIQITAITNLIKPVVDFSLTGIADDPANHSLTYRLRFTHPLAASNPAVAANIAALNGQAALLDDRSVRTFTGDVNPILSAYPMIPAGTIATTSITAWSKLPGFGTVSYALYDSGMNILLATPGSINLEFTRPSLILSGANPALYEYNSGVNPNLDVTITETGLYANLTAIEINTDKLSVSLNSGVLTTLTGLYSTLPTLGLGTYNLTYYYTGADADIVSLSATVSGTHTHALPISRQLVIQDTTAPIVNILGPISGITITNTNSISFTFTGTDNNTNSGVQFECKIDSGAWINCLSPMTYSSLTNGNYIISVRGIDASGNISTESNVSIIMNYIPTPVIPMNPTPGYAGGGGGGGSSFQKDNCPNGDYSSTYYDGSCGTKPIVSVNTGKIEQKIFNPTISNTCFTPINKTTIYQGNDVTQGFRTAHQMLYSYGLTVWRGTIDYRPYDGLTREEAAKFMVEFARNVLCREKTRTYSDRFSDIAGTDKTLLGFIKESYEYEIFDGDKDNDGDGVTTFRPFDRISDNELATIMIRLITHNKYKNEATGDERAAFYKEKLVNYSKDARLTDNGRSIVAEVIYDLYRNNTYKLEDVGYIVQ